MAQTGSTVEKVYLRQVRVRLAVLRERQSPDAQRVTEAETDLLAALNEVRAGGDLAAILESERTLLRDEHDQLANTPEMTGSLEVALKELDGAAAMIPLVRDPVEYARVDATHQFRTHRIGKAPRDVPRDDARMFFRSHHTRLQNLSKARGTDGEKAVLRARRQNMRRAESAYKDLQYRALGLEGGTEGR